MALLAGIDIGGTKLGVCVGDATGRVLGSDRLPTDPRAPAGPQVVRCLERVHELAQGAPIAALGAACPGPFLAPEGRFLDPPNMPGWHGFALREFLQARVPARVAAMNDANALALAEWRWGAGQGVRTLVYFTMSTGMGAGLVIDGRLYEGGRGFAGEIGHWRLDGEGPVGFGKRGSVEGFLSGPGIAQVAQAEARACLQTGEATALLDRGLEGITAERACELAHRGDAAARRAIGRCSARLGQLMALLVDLLEPELFVLGTIGSAWPDLFLPGARAELAREALAHSLAGLRIEPSQLADRGNQSALAVADLAIR